MRLNIKNDSCVELVTDGGQVLRTWGGDQPWQAQERAINELSRLLTDAPWRITREILIRIGALDG